MNTFLRTGLLVSLLTVTGVANADWSANLGFASDYYYRGLFQKQSSASGGVDYETGGFYAGVWAADVGGDIAPDGVEIDGYFGYGLDVGAVSLSAGYTGYFYTGDFDDTYQEINLGAGVGILSLDVAIGQYENFDGPTNDYTYYALTLEKNGFYGKYAGFSQDFEGEYFEAGYGTSVAGFDVGVYLLFSNKDLTGEANEAIVFTIGKAFDL
jgi:uncharacterized protein (TIGR02001 family)